MERKRKMGGRKMAKKPVITILGFLLFCGGLAQAVDFYSDATIIDGNVFDTVNIWDDAIVDMIGGIVESGIDTYNTSTLNVSGGDVYSIDLHNESVVNLSGGLRTVEGLHRSWIYPDTGTVNIYGRDLEWIIDSEKRVHGYWADDSEFLITLSRIQDATINLHEIPEPCTFALFGTISLFLRRRTRISCK